MGKARVGKARVSVNPRRASEGWVGGATHSLCGSSAERHGNSTELLEYGRLAMRPQGGKVRGYLQVHGGM